jgi:hypothetical protein
MKQSESTAVKDSTQWHPGYTQKNGAVYLYSPLKPHHSFVYALCMLVTSRRMLAYQVFDDYWVHIQTNMNRLLTSGRLYFVLQMPGFENGPFKGQHTD